MPGVSEGATPDERAEYFLEISDWYSNVLEEIVANWLAPLAYLLDHPNEKNSHFPSFDISQDDLSRLFSNVELVFCVELELIHDMKSKEDFGLEALLEVIENAQENFLVYKAFTKAYPAITDMLNKHSKTLEKHRELRGVTLVTLLGIPLTRLDFFVDQFKFLLATSPVQYREKIGSLLKNLQILQESSKNILTTSTNRLTVQNLAAEIDDYPGELFDPLRELVLEGEFCVLESRKYREYHFFLFNDLLVWATPCKNKRYQFKNEISLERANLIDAETELSISAMVQKTGSHSKFLPRIGKDKVRPCTITILKDESEVEEIKWKTKTPTEKAQLLIPLGEVISTWYNLRVFGIPLFDLIDRENHNSKEYIPVPKVLKELVNFFHDETKIKTEGIFRVSASRTQIRAFKREIDHGGNLKFLRTSTPFLIADLIKIFFREMPDSLLTFELYDDFVQTSEIIDPTQRVARIREVVDKLPEFRRDILKFMIKFLKRVASFSEFNRMNTKNLALLFEPNWLRPDPSQAYFPNISTMGNLVDTLITDESILFSEQHEITRSPFAEVEKLTKLKKDLKFNRTTFFESQFGQCLKEEEDEF